MDFVSGRGWNTSGQLLDEQERQELAAEIEWAYIRAPLEDIVMLEGEAEQGSDVILYQFKGSIFGFAWRTQFWVHFFSYLCNNKRE